MLSNIIVSGLKVIKEYFIEKPSFVIYASKTRVNLNNEIKKRNVK